MYFSPHRALCTFQAVRPLLGRARRVASEHPWLALRTYLRLKTKRYTACLQDRLVQVSLKLPRR